MPTPLLARCSLTLALLLLGASAHAQAPAVAIRGATVIDVTDGSLSRDQTVLIEGNRITAVEPVAEVAVPPGADVLEAAGAFVVPGLWDMHAHATNQQDPHTYLTLFIANGITGFREPWGSRAAADSALAAIAGRRLAGPPRQVVAGALIDGPAPVWPGSLTALTPEDGRRIVDSLYVAGAPFLKLYGSLLPETYFANRDARARARHAGDRTHPVSGCGRRGLRCRPAIDRATERRHQREPTSTGDIAMSRGRLMGASKGRPSRRRDF
jgi:hypothetical protein